ncbi:hypothetical protein [Dyella sp.]|uniref:hypothetical protein n=1 Tax=Dyella sp. TaxID=1869338 RepID=UPI002ED5C01E
MSIPFSRWLLTATLMAMGQGVWAQAASSSAADDDLASLDTRITPAVFNAAQNVAAIAQCSRLLYVDSIDGQRAMLASVCPDHTELKIRCDGDRCEAAH